MLRQFNLPQRKMSCISCNKASLLCISLHHLVWSGNSIVMGAWTLYPFFLLVHLNQRKKQVLKDCNVCLCIIMRRIHLLWFLTWPVQETVLGKENVLHSADWNMATQANFRLSGLDSVLHFGYVYLFIYDFVRSSGHMNCGRMPGFQSFSLASYVPPADKHSECCSLPRISIYSTTAFWIFVTDM